MFEILKCYTFRLLMVMENIFDVRGEKSILILCNTAPETRVYVCLSAYLYNHCKLLWTNYSYNEFIYKHYEKQL